MKTFKEIQAKWPITMQNYDPDGYTGDLEDHIEFLESHVRQLNQHLSEAVNILGFIANDESAEVPYADVFDFLERVNPDPDQPTITDCERNWKNLCAYLESKCPGWSIPPDNMLDLVIDAFNTIRKKEKM